MNLFSFLIILIYSLFSNLTTVIISKKSFGKCLPLTLMMTSFSLFISQILFKTFSIGFYICIIYSIFSLGYIIYRNKDKNYLEKIKKAYFTNGFYSFLIVLFVITIFDFNRKFSLWDEWTHWGEMLKEMLRLDKFYSVSESVLQVHKDYPPILQLFELFIIKLCGCYKETYAIFALHLLELSFFISIIPEEEYKNSIFKKNVISTVSICIIIFLITLFFDLHGIVNCIYNDYFMAIIVSYIMSIIFFTKNKTETFTLIQLCVSSSFLILTKQIGLTLYLMIIFFYFVSLFLEKDYKNNICKNILKIAIIIIIPVGMWFYWNNSVKSVNIDTQFKISDINIFELYNVYTGKTDNNDQTVAAKKFINSLFSENLSTSYIKLSYVQSIILGLFIMYIIYCKNKSIFKRKNLVALILTLIIGSVGYSFVMLNTYVFCFRGIESVELASFDRYMSTYVLIIMYINIILFLYSCYKSENVEKLIYVVIILFLISSTARISDIFPQIVMEQPNGYEINAKIIRKKLKGNKKVFIVAEDSIGDYQYMVKYYANPIIVNMTDYNWPLDSQTNYKQYYNGIKDKIEKYDYLYIAKINEEFKDKYQFVFENELAEFQLYKIKKENGNLKLILVE